MKIPTQVYAIRHNPTSKMYIGRSANVEKRVSQHMKMLRSGCHHVEDMQEDFNEFGEDYSVFILDEITKWAERTKEYYWMVKCGTYIRGVGYNYKDHAKKKLAEATGRWS